MSNKIAICAAAPRCRGLCADDTVQMKMDQQLTTGLDLLAPVCGNKPVLTRPWDSWKPWPQTMSVLLFHSFTHSCLCLASLNRILWSNVVVELFLMTSPSAGPKTTLTLWNLSRDNSFSLRPLMCLSAVGLLVFSQMAQGSKVTHPDSLWLLGYLDFLFNLFNSPT